MKEGPSTDEALRDDPTSGRSGVFAAGAENVRIHPAVAPLTEEIVVSKHRVSGRRLAFQQVSPGEETSSRAAPVCLCRSYIGVISFSTSWMARRAKGLQG